MKFQVLFFGATADAVGSREFELMADKTTTAKTLMDQLSKDHPSLARHKLLIAVNEEYADGNTVIADGDEIAIFTAVSGG